MRVLVLSDVHFASEGEQARRGHEATVIGNPILRVAANLYRRHIWLKDPYGQNYLLQKFIDTAGVAELVIANGDFTLDTAFVGVSDNAALESAQNCLAKLRDNYGLRFHATMGDHELGKKSLFGGAGGPRIQSLRRTVQDLKISPFWQLDLGDRVLIGVASSLVALPLFQPEFLPEERTGWEQAQAEHMTEIRTFFENLPSNRRVILFCHDPSALPFLHRDPIIRRRLPQFETTVIGHLHTPLVFGVSRWLAGMPVLQGMGNTARRLSAALNEAQCWREFHVQLCPSLAGCELLKDGGYLTAELPTKGKRLSFHRHALPR